VSPTIRAEELFAEMRPEGLKNRSNFSSDKPRRRDLGKEEISVYLEPRSCRNTGAGGPTPAIGAMRVGGKGAFSGACFQRGRSGDKSTEHRAGSGQGGGIRQVMFRRAPKEEERVGLRIPKGWAKARVSRNPRSVELPRLLEAATSSSGAPPGRRPASSQRRGLRCQAARQASKRERTRRWQRGGDGGPAGVGHAGQGTAERRGMAAGRLALIGRLRIRVGERQPVQARRCSGGQRRRSATPKDTCHD